MLAELVGCAVVDPPPLHAELPPAWQHTVADAAPAPDLRGWWKALNDPLLDGLVEQLLQQNLGLAQARGRLRQARALAGRDDALYRPNASLTARPVQDAAAIDTYYRSSLEVSWELALYGEGRAASRVADARIERALAEGQAAQVAAVAELTRQVLQLRAAQRELAATQALVALDEQLLAAERTRRSLQMGTLADEHAANERLAESRVRLAPPRHAADSAAQTIAALLGLTSPDAAWLASPLPGAPALGVVASVPADLLRTRADIRAAEAEVHQAAGELGLARAELYPRVVLGAAKVWSYNLTQNRRTVSGNVSGVGPFIDIPLFDWGRRKANADARNEALDNAVRAWRQTVVDAVAETEIALSALNLAHEQAQQQAEAVARAQTLRTQQAARAQHGFAAAPEKLQAERAALLAAQTLAASRLAESQAVVALYKALGGAPLFEGAAP